MSSEKQTIQACWNELYGTTADEKLNTFIYELDALSAQQTTAISEPDWYKDAVVYSLYVDLFNSDFTGLIDKLDYLQDLGVTCLWLLPILDSPMRDVGFDIRRYDRVRKELLGLSENASDEEQQAAFRHFLEEAHRRNLRVIFDIAMNHTSEEHEWFQQAKSSPENPYRDYYIWSDTDQKYKDARLLFKGLCPSNWEKCGDQYFFHRFYEFQPDLNYRQPDVLVAMCQNLLYWMGQGVDGFRADAIPFVWKEDDTSCENLPKAHTIVKFFRAVLDYVKPGMLLLAEACQPPKDVVEYFGNEDECHAGYHFPLMPQMFISLAQEDRTPIIDMLDEKQTPAIPASCQWFLFLRCHDELTLEMVTPEERDIINGYYLRDPLWTFREGEGISARLANLFEQDPQRIGLSYSIILTLPGTPIVYYGDEFGRQNDLEYFEAISQQTGHKDTRFLVRGKIKWDEVEQQLQDSSSFSSAVYTRVKHQLQTRNKYPTFGRGSLEWIDICDSQGLPLNQVFAYLRKDENTTILVLQNLSGKDVTIQPPEGLTEEASDLLGQPIPWNEDNTITLPSYSYYWALL